MSVWQLSPGAWFYIPGYEVKLQFHKNEGAYAIISTAADPGKTSKIIITTEVKEVE